MATGNGPEAHVSHASAGRVRIKVPGRRGDSDYFAEVARRLGQCPGVRQIAVNPLTGSILIEHESETAAILDFAETGDVVSLKPQEDVVPLAVTVREGAAEMDRRLREAAGNALDLWSATSLVFLALACVQLARGHYVGPASTLLWTAVAAMRMASR